ncbi:hypothetical protein [Williamsia phyllosphaerae]|uniref:Uncharacterized protein n=1 Tax=Williamsia phyllosphaerae TaxID=885042 RepID=A0ABQ1UIN2_9NOCA|nr:hypothetical protein [Williamsia phyllosphaerae]GGF19986.1 hypothetical protein GCM10007298_15000 [Williamsia phyllosphaerae]
MSTPQRPDGDDRVPSLAELDAMDLAEIEAGRTSADKDLKPSDDAGPVPRALHHARVLWIGGAIAGLASFAYGFLNLGTVSDALRQRLEEGVAVDPQNSAAPNQIGSLASTIPPVLLVLIVVLLAIQYPLLMAISRHNSRNCRSFFVTAVLVMVASIPIGMDLLFDYSEVSVVIRVLGWVQFALLLLSALFTLRRSVNVWLPATMKFMPGQTLRPGKRYR